jgi:predicted peptidase
LPENYNPEKSYRLVLFMHGAGDRGFSFDMLHKIDYGFVTTFMNDPMCHDNTILLIPQCPIPYLWVEDSWASGEYTMTNTPSPAIEAVKQLVDFVVDEYTVDKSLIYAVGVSMGGMAVWDMVARYTDFFAAVAPICGCLDESKIEEYLKTPIFTANDPRDTIVGADPTIRITQELKARGADIMYKQYDTDIRNDSSYHSTWIDAFSLDKSEDNLYNFIFSYRREFEDEEDNPNLDTTPENEQIDNTDRTESSKNDNETEEDEPRKSVYLLVVIPCIIAALSISVITPFVIRKILNDRKKD